MSEIKEKLQDLIHQVGGMRIEVEQGRAQTGVLMQIMEDVLRRLAEIKEQLK